MANTNSGESIEYFSGAGDAPIRVPSLFTLLVSRFSLPLLSLISRGQALQLGLTPVDDERVIMALKYSKGKVLDIGCGANNFIKSYQGVGTGVDVFPWEGCDVVVKNTAELPFEARSFDTVTFLACLNHISNRDEVLKEARRVLGQDGRVLVTMITPRWGKFIHWIRFRNDPDHKDRHIDHDHELLGMSSKHVKRLMAEAGFKNIRRKRFVFGLNNIYIGEK
jgi:ubiquinone/menaquinone biosynthesis C-methylase UbiE